MTTGPNGFICITSHSRAFLARNKPFYSLRTATILLEQFSTYSTNKRLVYVIVISAGARVAKRYRPDGPKGQMGMEKIYRSCSSPEA